MILVILVSLTAVTAIVRERSHFSPALQANL